MLIWARPTLKFQPCALSGERGRHGLASVARLTFECAADDADRVRVEAAFDVDQGMRGGRMDQRCAGCDEGREGEGVHCVAQQAGHVGAARRLCREPCGVVVVETRVPTTRAPPSPPACIP